MNAARSLAPDIRAFAIDRAPGEKSKLRVRDRQPALRSSINLGLARRGAKQQPLKRGATINARNSIAGQSTAQK